MCAEVGRVIRTPDIFVGVFNLYEEVIRWMDLPIFNKNGAKHLLPTQEASENRQWISSLIPKIMLRGNALLRDK